MTAQAKRREDLERRRKEEEEAQKSLTPEEQLAAKARALKMQEDADLEVAMDTFGRWHGGTGSYSLSADH